MMPTVEAQITDTLERLSVAEPALTAELIELLRRADISTLNNLFGVPKQQEAAPPPVPPLATEPAPRPLTAEEHEERARRADRFRRRPVIEGSTWTDYMMGRHT